MSQITHFRGILPSEGCAFAPPPSQASPGGLILNALYPLQDELDTALTRGDQQAALHIAYGALTRVADALAAYCGDRAQPGQALIHALLVDLTPLPLELCPDGTLIEPGLSVQVSYRNWTIEQAQTTAFACALADHCRAVWPGTWVVLPGGSAEV